MVRGGQLGRVEMAEVRLEVALDDGACVGHRRGRPPGRGLEPSVEQIGERAGSDPSPSGLGLHDLELATGEPPGAVDGLALPSGAPGSRIGAQVEAELPGVARPRRRIEPVPS